MKSTIEKSKFPIVGIGASAGGLEAITLLLKSLPPDTGMAFVYIQHLSPTHESVLTQLLAKVTTMKVTEAKDMMPVKPNHLYVVPPNKDIISANSVLKLTPRKNTHYPIDEFFYSLAQKHKERAIGIVLSGSATDGSQGLKAIKLEGGLTFAQDNTAKFTSMPKAAIAEGAVDYVLSPGGIANELTRLSSHSYLNYVVRRHGNEEVIKDNDNNLNNILALLSKKKGVDFSHYKISTLKRRILRRVVLNKLDTLNDYFKLLKKKVEEIDLLYNDMLINVTGFFRDRDTFEYVKKTVLPRLLKNKSGDDALRIWVPACATGEEAYSFAMMVTEILDDIVGNTPVQIFATDLSEQAIVKARLGEYSKNDLNSLSPKRILRFFTKSNGKYRVVKTIRDMCVFAPHNIFRDPPFSRLDLVSCCNLFIYLDRTLQKKALSVFHYALNDHGYLMLGKSETAGAANHLFSQVNHKFKIYFRRKEKGARLFPALDLQLPGEKIIKKHPLPHKIKYAEDSINLDKEIDSVLLSGYIPATVVINHHMEILQFRGNTSLYLHHASGKANLNILKMTNPEFSFELRNAVTMAIKTKHKVKKTGVELTRNAHSFLVTIEIVPLKIDWEEPLILVLFTKEQETETMAPRSNSRKNVSAAKERRMIKLEEELSATRSEMRSYVEQQDAANEELQSANEEIVSSNEELQSINEELETSKEEIESTNEELITTNQELQMRNEQLSESQAYTESLIATIHEKMIVLDKDLRVKSANRSFYRKFKVKESETEGRMLFDLGDKQWDIPRLRELLEDVIWKNEHFQDFEIKHVFPGIGEKVMLLNAESIEQKSRREKLILLAVEDVTERARKLEEEKDLWFKDIADTAPVMIWVTGADKLGTYFNRTWLDFTGRTMTEEIGNGWVEGLHKDDYNAAMKIYLKSFDAREPFTMEYRWRRYDAEYRWIAVSGKPRYSITREFVGYLGSCIDVHDQKMQKEDLEKKVSERTLDLEQANKNLERSNSELQQFAYVASHDLQEPLRKIITFSSRVQKQFKDNKPEAASPYLERIVDASKRMSRLIDDLLNFSRSTRTDKEFASTDLNTIAKDTLKDFDLIIQQKKAKIHIGELPVIEAIPLQMTQLFHNLLSNALKFSNDSGVVKISIESRNLNEDEVYENFKPEKSQEYVEIIIWDNGIGFEQKFADQIFVIFQRLHDRQTFSGTGIGLALCKRIVINHGGVIFAHSAPDRGTSFHVILPYMQK